VLDVGARYEGPERRHQTVLLQDMRTTLAVLVSQVEAITKDVEKARQGWFPRQENLSVGFGGP
jgi:hypothetical protein